MDVNRLFLNKSGLFSILVAFFFLSGCAGSGPSTSLTEKNIDQPPILKDATEIMEEARAQQAALYAPTTFREGMELYYEAIEDLNKKKNIKNIQEKLEQSVVCFEKAIEVTKLANIIFNDVKAARDDAIVAEAHKHASESWGFAERMFEEAAEILEGGNTVESKSKGNEAEKLYRNAELEAIQSKHMQETWSLLRKVEAIEAENYSPKTLKKIRNLVQQAETLLNKHRYDTDEARQLAQQAKYEANHAIYLVETIKKLEQAENTFEELLLESEKPLQIIAETFDKTVQFDQGTDIPTQEIVQAIINLQDENADFVITINDKNSEISVLKEHIDSLKTYIASMETRLSKLSSSEKDLAAIIEQQRIRQEKIARIKTSFTSEEGTTLWESDNIIIRLHGLNFLPGSSRIEPQDFSLLTKLLYAIREFPNSKLTIEGHTDSQGKNEDNRRLSIERAEAVRQYILANTNIFPNRISAEGYGESRPVANNETFEGRAKNRRIDVVIHPQ